MARKRFTAEQIILKLREAEVSMAQREGGGPGVQADGGNRTDLLPVEKGIGGPEDGSGQAAQGAGEGPGGSGVSPDGSVRAAAPVDGAVGRVSGRESETGR